MPLHHLLDLPVEIRHHIDEIQSFLIRSPLKEVRITVNEGIFGVPKTGTTPPLAPASNENSSDDDECILDETESKGECYPKHDKI